MDIFPIFYTVYDYCNPAQSKKQNIFLKWNFSMEVNCEIRRAPIHYDVLLQELEMSRNRLIWVYS